METKKFTQEEIKEIETLREQYAVVTAELGQIEVSRILLTQELDELNKKHTDSQQKYLGIQKEEETVVEKLKNKYGVGTVDLETYEFSPNK